MGHGGMGGMDGMLAWVDANVRTRMEDGDEGPGQDRSATGRGKRRACATWHGTWDFDVAVDCKILLAEYCCRNTASY